jgi:hypothetical protein
MARISKASSLAAKAASVSNNSLKDRKVLKRISFNIFEEEYLEDGWGYTLGTSKVDGNPTISINFTNDEGEEDVAFLSDECKALVEEGKLDTNKLNVCWYAPTDSEEAFVQVQRKAETYDKNDAKALALAYKQKKQKAK